MTADYGLRKEQLKEASLRVVGPRAEVASLSQA